MIIKTRLENIVYRKIFSCERPFTIITPLEVTIVIIPFTLAIFTIGYFFGKTRTERLLGSSFIDNIQTKGNPDNSTKKHNESING